MTTTVSPLILFSLPRSGSTLLQRMLSLHGRIASTAEPWLLIPQLYAFRETGIAAEYRHRSLVKAMEDFCGELPEGKETYIRELRRFVLSLYSAAAGPEASYFLDKTPRYALIAQDVLDVFPQGKFIFLWRNPLAAAASMVETWYDGKWRLRSRRLDLMESLENLLQARRSAGRRAIDVRFEDLLSDGESELKRICEYLELDFQPAMIDRFAKVDFNGRLGDPTGAVRYKQLSTEPLAKWKRTFCNPLRKSWARKYLCRIGPEALMQMGYSAEEISAELEEIPAGLRRLAGDAFETVRGTVRDTVKQPPPHRRRPRPG
ncbi:MAG: sulfotransferase family protein [Phycisphaerae bacterium]